MPGNGTSLTIRSDHICPQLSGQFSLTQSNQDQCSVDLNLEQVEEAMLN